MKERKKGSMGGLNQGKKKSKLTILNLKLWKHFVEDNNIVFVLCCHPEKGSRDLELCRSIRKEEKKDQNKKARERVRNEKRKIEE
jgi:hypothetical protein